ncbi:hypothetical protein AXI64_gp005 [Vibrio phage qdvp001]|uniref:hypothetical protein n=1 Tax=Vibrio phage qdvp001 TaxID=1003177 RepID=UPI0007215C09|nr:hypothetical protein AXI64_gp005 [Vibrio phage qdvp001]ALM61997.1 hypothetical protein qdvp001_005 [Vibrio phage qdvp001]
MFDSLKKIYYRWVINNLESDLFELETIKKSSTNWLFEDKILLDSDIKNAKIDLKDAKVKLDKLESM